MKNIGYNIYVLRQTACVVVNPITVDNFAFCFAFSSLIEHQRSDVRLYDISDLKTYISTRGLGPDVLSLAQLGMTVGSLLHQYSVVCAVESLALFYFLFIS